jgi:anaerobic selenocysteine-containing dehydrogenase
MPTTTANQALYGKMPGVTYSDYRYARLIIVWGANPSSSGIHLIPHIKAAQAAGAALVVIDPRRTNLARQADIHLAVEPGTDVVVALAMHRCGWGLERNRNGGNAALAVLALPTVAGKFGVRGGGYSMSNTGAWTHSPEDWIGAPEPNTRLVNMNHLGRALLDYRDPPVQMLFVYNCNPAVTMPNQNKVLEGLARQDLFTVVFDQVMTDTAALADVVLPATTFLESYDIVTSYGLSTMQLAKPAIDAVGQARPNVEVFAELANRLGLAASGEHTTDVETLLAVTGTMPDEVGRDLMGAGIVTDPAGGAPIQFVDVSPRTPDGKVQLFPEALDHQTPSGLYRYQEHPATSEYPLNLISPATEKTINSSLGELRRGPASLHMHPDDAEPRGLSTGDTVRMFNPLGEVHSPLTLNPDMRRGTVGLPKGLWRMSTLNGSTANALVSDDLTDIGGGAVFNDVRVEVARVVTVSLDAEDVSKWDADSGDAVH